MHMIKSSKSMLPVNDYCFYPIGLPANVTDRLTFQ
ncbi:hypothetical protein DFQ13_110231 [Actinokineospora spheciospongiae]|nr:hypothetical protein DFQ13_110231 [Actinokineospora spheciospongiae]